MSRRSNRCPVFLETTGCWGISPEMAQYILALVFCVLGGGAAYSPALGHEAATALLWALAALGVGCAYDL